MKESVTRALTLVWIIMFVGGREKYMRRRRQRLPLKIAIAQTRAAAFSSRSRANNRSRLRTFGDDRPYFSGRFRTHAVYHWPTAKKGRPRPACTGLICGRHDGAVNDDSVWPRLVFILTGLVVVYNARAIARLTLAALPSHRIPTRWSHWTGPPFISFFIFFSYPPLGARTHNTRIRPAECVVRVRRRTVLYTYVHVSARIPLRVCVRRSLSHFSFWRYAPPPPPPPMAFIIHTTIAS